MFQASRVIDGLLSDEVTTRLEEIAYSLNEQYQFAKPFPHIIIDDFLPAELLEPLLDQFPKPGQVTWREFDNDNEKKLEFSKAESMPTDIRDFLYFLNCRVMLEFLERLTGIDALIPDPYFGGGGLHEIERGGKLEVHADFNWLDKLRLDRRLNLLLYLNKDWREEYGGHLELWSRDMTECVKKVLPIFNRCVIFSTTDYAFHGHPLPLTCPAGQTRKSIATYYYTNGRPEEEKSSPHSTLFQRRTGGTSENQSNGVRMVKSVVRSIVPPIILDGYRFVRDRRQ
ncbi:MAG TPA: 2OG-Fe(II) oxygenase [Blastocatellia bacterium]